MSELGPRIRAPKPLWIVTILHGADPVEFAFRQGRLGLSASDHWKQISVLSEAGYVKVNKSGRGRGARHGSV